MSTYDFESLFDADEYLYFLAETLEQEDTPKQCTFLEQVLALEPGASLLDLGCGHGRHAIELGARGYKVLGIDLVAGFIARATQEAEARGVEVGFLHGDMRGFQADGELDAITCLFDAFGFFRDEDDEEVVRRVARALKPGGRFLLDLRPREVVLRLPAVSVLDKGNGDMMIDRHQFDVESGRLIDRRTYLRGGHAREVRFSVRLYSYTEIRGVLTRAGLEVGGVYGGYDGSPLTLGSTRMLVLARKPG